MFDVVGRTVVVDEKHMDAVTALSASGPAYIYIILESLRLRLTISLIAALSDGDTIGMPALAMTAQYVSLLRPTS